MTVTIIWYTRFFSTPKISRLLLYTSVISKYIKIYVNDQHQYRPQRKLNLMDGSGAFCFLAVNSLVTSGEVTRCLAPAATVNAHRNPRLSSAGPCPVVMTTRTVRLRPCEACRKVTQIIPNGPIHAFCPAGQHSRGKKNKKTKQRRPLASCEVPSDAAASFSGGKRSACKERDQLVLGHEAPPRKQDSCPLGAKQFHAHPGERQLSTADGVKVWRKSETLNWNRSNEELYGNYYGGHYILSITGAHEKPNIPTTKHRTSMCECVYIYTHTKHTEIRKKHFFNHLSA